MLWLMLGRIYIFSTCFKENMLPSEMMVITHIPPVWPWNGVMRIRYLQILCSSSALVYLEHLSQGNLISLFNIKFSETSQVSSGSGPSQGQVDLHNGDVKRQKHEVRCLLWGLLYPRGDERSTLDQSDLQLSVSWPHYRGLTLMDCSWPLLNQPLLPNP